MQVSLDSKINYLGDSETHYKGVILTNHDVRFTSTALLMSKSKYQLRMKIVTYTSAYILYFS